MDGNTEPVIAVIGHPIAGNPSQLALERAFQSLGLEWRVFSFDVSPERLTTALDGLDALGVRGVLIDESLNQAGRLPGAEVEPDYTDCLYREQLDATLSPFAAQQTWVSKLINGHAASLKRDLEQTFVAGEIPVRAVWRTTLVEGTIKKLPRDAEKIVGADLIVIEQEGEEPAMLDIERWPTGAPSTLVVDFSDGHPDIPEIRSLGYQTVSREQRRLGMLSECFRLWTSVEAPQDVMLDAIEEYLAV